MARMPLLVAPLLLSCGGCGTLYSWTYDERPRPFGGVAAAIDDLTHPSGPEILVLWPLILVDIPVSAVCDAVLLPWTVPPAIKDGVARRRAYRKLETFEPTSVSVYEPWIPPEWAYETPPNRKTLSVTAARFPDSIE